MVPFREKGYISKKILKGGCMRFLTVIADCTTPIIDFGMLLTLGNA